MIGPRRRADLRDSDRVADPFFPWTVAFLFGVLHGLGFVRALQELGLLEGDVPLALVAFNLGAEAGQLMFIAAGWRRGCSSRASRAAARSSARRAPSRRDCACGARGSAGAPKGRTEALENLAVEMLARGLSVRDIEDAFRAGDGRLLLSRIAVSELGPSSSGATTRTSPPGI